MRVKFLTNETRHKLNNNPLIEQIDRINIEEFLLIRDLDSVVSYKDFFVVAHDIETKYRFPQKGGLLLSAFCNNNEDVLVIDNTSIDNNDVFPPDILKRCLFVAHNADFEARWGVVHNFLPARYACTMVNDRRLLSGQVGYRFDLISVINRRLGYRYIPEWMEKDIRKDFATITEFTDQHILYNAADTITLRPILQKQLELANNYNQVYLHNTINSRTIIPVAKAEMVGIKHDTDKWLRITKEKQDKSIEITTNLNELVTNQYGLDPSQINPILKKKIESREKKIERLKQRKIKLQNQINTLVQKEKTHLKSYTISVEHLSNCEKQLTEAVNTDLLSSEDVINWGSPKQVIQVFKAIGCPVPKAKDKESHQLKEGVGKEARANWFVQNSGKEFIDLMTKFDSYKKIAHTINAFGEKWVESYVINGRVHTLFDQAGTATGRFSSGDKGRQQKLHPNIQQIPVRGENKVYRECFVADENRAIITADYRNCEGIVMIALSKDLGMKPIIEMDDSHSYLGTLAWRAVYKHRYERTGDPKWKELSETYEMNQSTPEKIEERTIFKNSGGLFPVVYGVAASKVAATSKIIEPEGQAMITAIKSLVPKVVETLEGKAKEATTLGYVKHNDRTGSRRWFTPVLDHLHYGYPITKRDLIEAEMAGRNSPIQGTNSDIMKEAIAMVELYSTLFKLDIRFLLTAHDEGAWDVPVQEADFYAAKIKELLIRAAKPYLIPEIDMDVDVRVADYWKK